MNIENIGTSILMRNLESWCILNKRFFVIDLRGWCSFISPFCTLTIVGEAFPASWLQKAAIELDNLSRVLESEGVKVRRPDEFDYAVEQSVSLFNK